MTTTATPRNDQLRATELEHLEDALAAEKLTLSESEVSELEEPYVPHAISGH